MVEEASLKFRLRKIDETRNYLLDEIKQNDLISEKYKKTCKYLNYQFEIFKPLSYCFKEAKGFDVKASFANRP